MKIYQRLLLSGQVKAYNLDTTAQALSEFHCPASIEFRHDFIGEKKMEKFCRHGCSTICLKEYLEMKILK